jgi:hypothetical protein
MGYISPRTIALHVATNSVSPADAATYYFGGVGVKNPDTNAAVKRLYTPMSGRIIAAVVSMYSLTATGTNEDITMYIRVNNTTDYTLAVVGVADAHRVFSNQSLAIPLTVGDYIEIKMVSPTWATNPEGCYFTGSVVIAVP